MDYISQHYSPLSILVYGSYSDGSNNQNSDFDALVISKDHEIFHDTSIVDGIQLDIFVYPSSYFDQEYDCEDFVQIFESIIVTDTDDRARTLKDRVLSYIEKRSHKSDADIAAEIAWCQKMLLRTERNDVEGMFRWHWVLIDSLEIFCDMVHHFYCGPKKTLKWMKSQYPEAFMLYQKALFQLNEKSLRDWIQYLTALEQSIRKRSIIAR